MQVFFYFSGEKIPAKIPGRLFFRSRAPFLFFSSLFLLSFYFFTGHQIGILSARPGDFHAHSRYFHVQNLAVQPRGDAVRAFGAAGSEDMPDLSD